MRPKKVIPRVNVVYLEDAAGVPAGTEKPLPENLASELIKRGIVALADGEVQVKEEKQPRKTKEEKQPRKTKEEKVSRKTK